MLYAKQCIFDFQNRPGKQLARVLASPMLPHSFSSMRKPNGELTRDTLEKLQIFLDYYSNLYAPQDNQDGGNVFFKKVIFLLN